MSDADCEREAERRCERWLDVDAPLPMGDDAPAAAAEQVRRRIADQQLVDALLQSLADRDSGDTSRRVQRVIEAIGAESATPPTSTHWTARIVSVFGLAACLLIAGTLLVIRSASESRAAEILAKIREVSLADTDRIYHVFHSNAEHDDRLEFRGKLYLRGTTGFVLRVDDLVFGRTGSEYWVVPPEGPVVLADDFGWLKTPSTQDALELALLKDLSVTSRRTPLMQLATIVELIEGDYDVSVRPGPQEAPRRLDELSAVRRPADEELPATIRLWFDPETKTVYNVELTWSMGDGLSPRHDMQFVLAPAEPITDEWYQHSAHHAADRPVRRAVAEPTESSSPAKGEK